MRPFNPLPSEVRILKAIDLRIMIHEIQQTLWFDHGAPGTKPVPNPDKPLTLTMLDDIAAALEAHGLKPKPPSGAKAEGPTDANS